MRPKRPRLVPHSNAIVGGPPRRAEPVLLPDEFARAVHDLLTHLYDPAYVQTHPLAQLACNSSEATSKPAGQILRRDVLAAIESLRASSEDTNAKKGRGFQILSWRYVDGLSIEEVRDRLAISHSTYYREYQRGVRALVSVLRSRWSNTDGLPDEPARVQLVRADPGEAVPRAGTTFQARKGISVHLTKLIGRDRELAEVTRLLSTTRLLTLTGTGGCGKTRLAWQLTEELAEAFSDGVGVVELGALTDPDLIAQSIAMALGLAVGRDQSPTDVLERHLRDRRLLLVLDNCEHLIAPCVQLVDRLVTSCPRLTVLTTSRQVLGMIGEIGWRVPSLGTPNPEDLSRAGDDPVSTALAYPAVQLFVERAQAALSEFSLGVNNVDAIVQICWRLDGIPLAIELAATLVAGITPAQIARRLDDRFQLLTFGDPSALPRQRTLLATLDWSHSLLSDDERTLFRRLAVFAGPFTLEAVEDVCGTDLLFRAHVLPCLVRLVEKSLVVMLPVRDEARYRLLETIREYARERLTVAGEADALAGRHRDWYVRLVDQIGNGLWDENQGVWLNRLQDEYDNLRISLAWFRDHDATAGLRLASHLWRFWIDRGYMREGERWLTSLLDRSPERTILRARALCGLGYLQIKGRGLGLCESTLRESLSIFEEHGDMAGTGVTLVQLGRVAMYDNQDYQRAAEFFDTALTALRGAPNLSEAGDRSMTALACADWAIVSSWQGKWDQAHALFEEGFEDFRRIGDRRGMSYALRHLGELQRYKGQYALAGNNLERSLSFARETGIAFHIADALVKSADLARSVGDLRRSKALLEECLALSREAGQDHGIGSAHYSLGQLAVVDGKDLEAEARFMEGLAQDGLWKAHLDVARDLSTLGSLAVRADHFDRGVRLIASATTLHSLFPTILDPKDSARCDTSVERAKVELGPERFADAWPEGTSMTMEQAIAYALGSDPFVSHG